MVKIIFKKPTGLARKYVGTTAPVIKFILHYLPKKYAF